MVAVAVVHRLPELTALLEMPVPLVEEVRVPQTTEVARLQFILLEEMEDLEEHMENIIHLIRQATQVMVELVEQTILEEMVQME